MLVEMRKAGFVNKGAELMLYAVLEKMKEARPDADFVMAPTAMHGSAPYARRAELGFFQKAWWWRYGIQWGDLAVLAPKKLREAYGIVLDKDVNIVIDSAGFAYGDHWGIGGIRELAFASKRWRRQGTRVILLPQAMGPFTSDKAKRYMNIAADNIDLMFPRDWVSYQHLTEAVGARPNILQSPDFTNLIKGIVPDNFDPQNNWFCIVPNHRMMNKTLKSQSEAYIPFMIKCSRYLFEKGQKPFILIHEGPMDFKLARQISEGAGAGLPILQESHPLKIKGILGVCQGAIGSRYHGIVSALSQGIPCLATGWSHKYKTLLNDYGFHDGFLDVTASDEEIHRKIDLIVEPQSRQKIISEAMLKSNKLKRQSEEMWNKVFDVLGLK